MGEHVGRGGPRHDADCLAGRMNDAYCGCSRAAWLDEMVPRAQARAELLAHLEKWSHEQRAFQNADLNSVRAPVDANPLLAEFVRDGARLAGSVVRSTWERMAVGALNMRKECDVRLAALEAAEPKPAPEPPSAPALADQIARAVGGEGAVTLQTAGDRL